MSKTKQLNSLFKRWEEDFRKCYNEKGATEKLNKFCLDGIIDEEVFEKQKTKVLFISNEANLGENFKNANGCNEIYDRRENFLEYHDKKHDNWTGKLRERVCCLYQVIIDDYSTEPFNVADCFAFMNLNKRGGSNQCDMTHLKKYCSAYKEEIQKEIEIISPDLIIWLGCNSYDARIPEIIDVDKSIPIIRMWHTSYIGGRARRLNKFKNALIDKLAFKLVQELKKANLR